MQFTGRWPTEKEFSKMADSWDINHGEEWAPEKILFYISYAVDAIDRDQRLNKTIGASLEQMEMSYASSACR